MVDRLKGKMAIVFGAGSSGPGWGNGKAAAVAFAREGAQVACVDLVEAAAAETSETVKGEGGAAISVTADITQSGSVEAAVAQTLAHLGRIDILHNNVGVTHMGGPIELSEEQFRTALDLNIGSVYRTAKAVLPHMLQQGSGAIINVSSRRHSLDRLPVLHLLCRKGRGQPSNGGVGHPVRSPRHSCQLHHARAD